MFMNCTGHCQLRWMQHEVQWPWCFLVCLRNQPVENLAPESHTTWSLPPLSSTYVRTTSMRRRYQPPCRSPSRPSLLCTCADKGHRCGLWLALAGLRSASASPPPMGWGRTKGEEPPRIRLVAGMELLTWELAKAVDRGHHVWTRSVSLSSSYCVLCSAFK